MNTYFLRIEREREGLTLADFKDMIAALEETLGVPSSALASFREEPRGARLVASWEPEPE